MNKAKEPANIEEENKEWKPYYSMEEDFQSDMEQWGISEDEW